MTAALLLALLLSSETTPRAVMLPLRLPASPAPELLSSAAGVERAIVDALGRHASFHVMTRAEIAAIAGAAAREQLLGCDAESCMTEVADALGAGFIVTASLDRAGGGWNLHASLLDRVHVEAVRRAGVNAVSLDALMSSVDLIARELAGGSSAALDDPELARRLGTDAATAAEFTSSARSAGTDVTSGWTRFLIARNAEREWLAFVEGGLLFALGSLALAGLVLDLLPGSWIALALVVNGPNRADGTPDVAGQRFAFPAGLLVARLGVLAVMSAAWFVLLGALAAVSIVDVMNPGAIHVRREGCCRDERQVSAAEKPGWGRRAAPVLAGLGAAAALSFPIVVVISGIGLSALMVSAHLPAVTGPTVGVDAPTYVGLYAFTLATTNGLPSAGIAVTGALCIAGALILIFTERAPLTDTE